MLGRKLIQIQAPIDQLKILIEFSNIENTN